MFALTSMLLVVVEILLVGATTQNDTPWILVCDRSNWEGRCAYLESRAGQCTNFPGHWNDIISSIRNDDPDLYRCTWFEDIDCGGRSYDEQENTGLNNGEGFFDDRISSWICERLADQRSDKQKPLT